VIGARRARWTSSHRYIHGGGGGTCRLAAQLETRSDRQSSAGDRSGAVPSVGGPGLSHAPPHRPIDWVLDQAFKAPERVDRGPPSWLPLSCVLLLRHGESGLEAALGAFAAA